MERFATLDVSIYEKLNLDKHFLADYNRQEQVNIALEIVAIIKVFTALASRESVVSCPFSNSSRTKLPALASKSSSSSARRFPVLLRLPNRPTKSPIRTLSRLAGRLSRTPTSSYPCQ